MNTLQKWSSIAILAIVLAGAFVYFGARAATETRHLFLPVEVFNLPIDLTLATPPPKGVTLTIRGPAAVVNQFADQLPAYSLDLSGTAAGANPIAVNSDLLNLPPALTEVEIHPPELLIKLETAAVKNVPVSVNLMGQLAPGFMLVDTLVEPATVTITGPQSLIDSVERLMTQPISIDGQSDSFRKEIAVTVPEAVVLRASSPIATVDIRIAERIDTRKISGIPVMTAPLQYSTVIAPPVIELEIRGPERTLSLLDFSDGSTETGTVIIDTTGLKPGIYLLRAAIQLPLNTTLMGASPEFFTVTVAAPAASGNPADKTASP